MEVGSVPSFIPDYSSLGYRLRLVKGGDRVEIRSLLWPLSPSPIIPEVDGRRAKGVRHDSGYGYPAKVRFGRRTLVVILPTACAARRRLDRGLHLEGDFGGFGARSVNLTVENDLELVREIVAASGEDGSPPFFLTGED